MNAIRETHRLRGVSAVAFLAGAFGVVAQSAPVLLAGVVGVAFAAYARSATPPDVTLDFSRTVSDTDPQPGEKVAVTVTVENTGESLLADLRVVDGVPDALAVTDGLPRLGTALRPGASASFSYTVEVGRGRHEFGPAQVLARDFSGAVERETTADDETVLTCAPTLASADSVPLRSQTTQYTGRVTTDLGGSGVEFHATREYQRGDPMSRIDWNRHARTGELTTVEFREERAATVVLVVDAREEAYRAASDGDGDGGESARAHAVHHSVDAAGRVFTSLLDSGDRVGVTALSPEAFWLPPGTGADHRARAREAFATASVFAHAPPEETFYPTIRLDWLRKQLPADAQVVLFSPLCDDFVVEVARRFDAFGHRVTVVSPDPTAAGTPGQRLARAERDARLHELRQSGLRAVDWNPDDSLSATLARARRRWSS